MPESFISKRLYSFLIGFWCILVSDILERIAFFAFLGGIVVFLNGEPLRWTEINALYLAFIFIGITYSSAFFGSLIADLLLGNFKTICLGYIIYIAGYVYWLVLVTHLSQVDVAKIPAMCSGHDFRNSSSMPEFMTNILDNFKWSSAKYLKDAPIGLQDSLNFGNASIINITTILHPANLQRRYMQWEKCSWPITFIICLISIGSGMVRTNTARFGAEHQVEFQAIKEAAFGGGDSDKKRLKRESYSVRNFFSLLSWLSNSGSLLAIAGLTYIQLYVDYMHLSFILATACLAGAFLIFFCGGLWYLPSKTIPKGAILTALRAACCCYTIREGYETIDTGVHSTSIDDNAGVPTEYSREDGKRFWFLAVISLILVPYWLIYHQMLTTFPFQALHMDLDVNGFDMPVAWMYLVEAGVVAILIPVIKISILPHLESIGRPLSMRARMIIGIVFAIASVTLAGGVELVRRNIYWESNVTAITQTINNNTYYAAEMSVLWQFPQYFLMGISDSLASVAGIELVYSQIPKGMRGLGLGIFWLFSGLASFISCIISLIGYNVWIFDWDDGNPNCRLVCEDDITKICYECKMEIFFFTLAGLAFLCLILFIVLTARWHVGVEYKYDKAGCINTNSWTNNAGYVAENPLFSEHVRGHNK